MPFQTTFFRSWAFVLILSILASAPATGQEPAAYYYMMIFSAQPASPSPRLSHSFATFVKVTGTGAWRDDYRIDSHTISWMPRSLNILVLRRRPEPGTNLNLQSSLWWAESVNCRVSMWGPYQICKELYERAVQQEARLWSGRMLYKSIDSKFRPGPVTNCIHAISDLDTEHGLLHVGTARGDAASYQIAQHLRRWIIDPGRVHPWVASLLGLNEHAIRWQALEQPTW